MQDYLLNAVRRCNQLLGETDAAYHEMAVRLDLSDSALRILYALHIEGKGRCPLQKILQESGLCKQTLNSALRRLETQGAVRLVRADGRSKDVCLTEEGRLLVQRTAALVLRAEQEVFAAWPKQDVCRYIALQEKYLRDIRQKAASLEKPDAGGAEKDGPGHTAPAGRQP